MTNPNDFDRMIRSPKMTVEELYILLDLIRLRITYYLQKGDQEGVRRLGVLRAKIEHSIQKE